MRTFRGRSSRIGHRVADLDGNGRGSVLSGLQTIFPCLINYDHKKLVEKKVCGLAYALNICIYTLNIYINMLA